MLKTRLIPVLYILNGLIVRSEGFHTHQNIGNIINQAQRLNEWDADELIYIDITRAGSYNLGRDDHRIASYSGIGEIVERIGKVCFMPLTFGGGIRSVEDADLRIRHGADKVTLNAGAISDPGLLGRIAQRYGSQAVVASVDYRIVDGKPLVFSDFGRANTGVDVAEMVRRHVGAGAGEILLTSIDRDGMAEGYDLATIATVTAMATVPVIACGGAGSFHDFVEVARETGVSAVAAGNIFHFTERSYPRAKRLMAKEGINVRI
jgi:cyclase